MFMVPLTDKQQLQDIIEEMPQEIIDEIDVYLEERGKKIIDLKDQGIDAQSSKFLLSEKNEMGLNLRN